MTSACNLKKFISLAHNARPTSGHYVSLRHFWPTLFNIQQSRLISLQFARCILSKALQILWLIVCSYNEYLEESRQFKVIPPGYAFQLLMTSWWWFFVLSIWAFQTIACFGRHVPCPFFGFLCSAELTIPNLASFSPSIHLGLADVAVDSMSSPSCLQLRIKASKTDCPLIAPIGSIRIFAASLALPNSYLNRLYWFRPLIVGDACSWAVFRWRSSFLAWPVIVPDIPCSWVHGFGLSAEQHRILLAISVQFGRHSRALGVVCTSFVLFVGLGLGIGSWKVLGFGPSSTLCAGPSFSKHFGRVWWLLLTGWSWIPYAFSSVWFGASPLF